MQSRCERRPMHRSAAHSFPAIVIAKRQRMLPATHAYVVPVKLVRAFLIAHPIALRIPKRPRIEANHLEPKLSPFDPLALLDEIMRLVPGYTVDRINLFGGNDVRTEPGFVPVATLTEDSSGLILPAHDGLFTSGTLSKYSANLKELERHQTHELRESAAD